MTTSPSRFLRLWGGGLIFMPTPQKELEPLLLLLFVCLPTQLKITVLDSQLMLRGKGMGKIFTDTVEKALTEAPACRIAVYPRQHGWVSERVQLELADSVAQLGETTPSRGGGHYLVDGLSAEEAAQEARRLRGKPVEIIRIE